MAKVMIAFSRPRDEKDGPTLGPFPWVQLTYTELRSGPNGDPIAMFGEDGDWHLGRVETAIKGPHGWVEVSPDLRAEPWSDIVIHADDGEAMQRVDGETATESASQGSSPCVSETRSKPPVW